MTFAWPCGLPWDAAEGRAARGQLRKPYQMVCRLDPGQTPVNGTGTYAKNGTRERENAIHLAGDTPGKGKPSVRYATAEQFKMAHEKTSKLHAGLFRRLAE